MSIVSRRVCLICKIPQTLEAFTTKSWVCDDCATKATLDGTPEPFAGAVVNGSFVNGSFVNHNQNSSSNRSTPERQRIPIHRAVPRSPLSGQRLGSFSQVSSASAVQRHVILSPRPTEDTLPHVPTIVVPSASVADVSGTVVQPAPKPSAPTSSPTWVPPSSEARPWLDVDALPPVVWAKFAASGPSASRDSRADLEKIIESASDYEAMFPVRCQGRVFSLQHQVHHKLRLTSLFLHKIGRDMRASDEVLSAKGHYEYNKLHEQHLTGLLNVKLMNELKDSKEDFDIEISAEKLHSYLHLMCGEKQIKSWLCTWKGHVWLKDGNSATVVDAEPLQISHPRELYGDKAFHITFKEVCQLADSTKIFVGPDLPKKFFIHLIGIVSRDNLVEFYNDRKAVPLVTMAQYYDNLCQVGRFIEQLTKGKWKDYGFTDDAHVKRTIKQSITELSTQVCVVTRGHFFTGNDNQIQEKPAMPITFISVPGIDFMRDAASRMEMSKYFMKSGFVHGGKEAFKSRVKCIYHIVFTACKEFNVTHPTAIPLGIGYFLPPVEQDTVKRIYHEAQFELLQENDYGFDTYFLNPGPARDIARKLLADYRFKCRVALHYKEGKALASQLAKMGKRTSFLTPSDCIAVMQGCVGYWWETGMGDRYSGQEDAYATSTAIVARANICPIWSALDHHKIEEEIDRITEVPFTHCDEKDGLGLAVDANWNLIRQETYIGTSEGRRMSDAANGRRASDFAPGFSYEIEIGGKKLQMRFFRILWVDTEKHHDLHLKAMVESMKRHGITVDVAHSTREAINLLKQSEDDTPFNFVMTSLFVKMKKLTGGQDVLVDSGHKLLQELQNLSCCQKYYFCTVCASMSAINSHERSTLYSEQCNMVKFNLHTRHFEEVMDALCEVQRHSDRLCLAVASPTLRGERKREVVANLIQFNVDPDFPPKSWVPLHHAARDKHLDPEILRMLLKANANVHLPTRYATDGVPRGATPLYVAVLNENAEAVKLLLEYGASPYTPLLLDKSDAVTNLNKTAPIDLADVQNNQELLAKLRAYSKEQCPPALPEMQVLDDSLFHSCLALLWISTSETLSPNLERVRRLLDTVPTLLTQTLCCAETADGLDEWLQRELYPFLEDVGTDEEHMYEHLRAKLLWVQCIVIEVTDPKRLKIWVRLVEAIKARVRERRGSAPWLKILTYTEGLAARQFDEPLKAQRYFMHFEKPEEEAEGVGEIHYVLNSNQRYGEGIGREVICAVNVEKGTKIKDTDPRVPECHAGIVNFYHELQNAATHWAWEDNRGFPVPYDALTSSDIETKYKDGSPWCRVNNGFHKVYFRDMLQRQTQNPMLVRLVMRYPVPCMDCDAQVRSFPSLLEDIANGQCLVFIGAGFCIPAGGPSWGQLLKEIAAKGVKEAEDHEKAGEIMSNQRSADEMRAVQQEVLKRTQAGSDHTAFEMAAQLLEDALGHRMQEHLADILRAKVDRGADIIKRRDLLDQKNRDFMDDGKDKGSVHVMASRINYIQCLKFGSVLTTNYSQELCICEQTHDPQNKIAGCPICQGIAPLLKKDGSDGEMEEPPYLDIIRKISSDVLPLKDRPMIQIHGSVAKPYTIVLSREGYRSLLHDKPHYYDFLKSVMMTRTILYIGFSFTDDYLNEVRSDVMSMKRNSPSTKNLAYAIINDKSEVDCRHYDEHEGVKMLTWSSQDYGFGVMDRYLESILNMTDTAAALSASKVILFSPPGDKNTRPGSAQKMMKLKAELDSELTKSEVFQVMSQGSYQKYKVVTTEKLSEVERALQMDDFLQPWVVTFTDSDWKSIPMIHQELMEFLWHPHARLNTEVYSPLLLVWGNEESARPDSKNAAQISLKEQYESHLHVRYCTSLEELLSSFRRIRLPNVEYVGESGSSFWKTTSAAVRNAIKLSRTQPINTKLDGERKSPLSSPINNPKQGPVHHR